MLRLIGDVHGDMERYTRLLKESPYPTLQLGDMGFKSDYERLRGIDYTQHRFIPGNHDDYDNLPFHAYHDPFGFKQHGGVDFFYIRGANSIDRTRRIEGFDWWACEELSFLEMGEALEAYIAFKPKIMITHDCPESVVEFLFGYRSFKSRTGQLLDIALENHKPDYWYFGHHHVHRRRVYGETIFCCLSVLQCVDISADSLRV